MRTSERLTTRATPRIEEALSLVLSSAPPPALESVALADALGRVLTESLSAGMDQPPFDKAAMDGFAHSSSAPALEGPWRVVGLAAAGSRLSREVGRGECVRIMTGAPLPPGARAVQRLEWTEGTDLVRFTRAESRDNVIRRGENQKAGDILLGPRVIAAQDIGILASSGYSDVLVAKRPRVSVISTGDELTAPGAELGAGKIYDSNGPQLAAQAAASGCEARFLGIVRDDADELAAAFGEALEDCDVLIVSGGVSVGDFDYIPRALARAGVEPLFHGLAMKPGRRAFFGRCREPAARGAVVFGLPGNPVSTFVGFEVLVRPLVAALCGIDFSPRLVSARLAADVSRSETELAEFLPARLETGDEGLPSVKVLEYGGSSMLSVFAEADCLVSMGPGVGSLGKGSVVDARLVRS